MHSRIPDSYLDPPKRAESFAAFILYMAKGPANVQYRNWDHTMPDPAANQATPPPVNPAFSHSEPPAFSWQLDHMNSVKLIGTVGQPPQIKHVKGSRTVATVRLGIKSPPGRLGGRAWSWVDVDFWDDDAFQIQSYVQKGTLLAVVGYFKQDTWISKVTNRETSNVKVVADYFQVVDPVTGSLLQLTSPPPPTIPSSGFSGSGSRDNYDLSVYTAWRNSGVSWLDMAAQQNKSPGTYLQAITDSLRRPTAEITQDEALRLAYEVNIGPSNSPWLDFDTLSSAIDEVIKEQTAAGQSVNFQTMRLKPVYEKLYTMTSPRRGSDGETLVSVAGMLESQVESHPKLGLTLTYGQIRFVKAMKQRNIDLGGDQIKECPKCLTEEFAKLPPPSYPAAGNTSPMQNPYEMMQPGIYPSQEDGSGQAQSSQQKQPQYGQGQQPQYGTQPQYRQLNPSQPYQGQTEGRWPANTRAPF